MTTDGERIRALEVKLDDLRGDVQDLTTETGRTRNRLHDLEGLAGTLVDQEKVRRQNEARRQRRLEIRTEVLAVVVATAALVEPFLYHLATGN